MYKEKATKVELKALADRTSGQGGPLSIMFTDFKSLYEEGVK